MSREEQKPTNGQLENADVFTVLIVDDFAPICREVKWCLEGLYGVQVLIAENGELGLQMMAEHLPCLVILDLNMPVLDGFGFLERRALIESIQNIPVVVLTAQETTGDAITRALLLGATDYLRKPIDANDLRQYIAARVTLAERQKRIQERERILRHDMSNPLTVLIALGQFLQDADTAADPEEVVRLGKQIAESGERLRHVMNELLKPNR